MARLRERIDSAEKALARLDEALAITRPTLLDRDGAIQRFEFTFEAVWKAAKDYLLAIEGIDTASPKGVIRYCREVGLLTDEEAHEALNMADDRNLTVHTYNDGCSHFQPVAPVPADYGGFVGAHGGPVG